MAAKDSEAKGLMQIVNSSNVSHGKLSPKGNRYFWTTYTTNTTNSSPLSHDLLQQTMDAMKKDINRQIYGGPDYVGLRKVEYGDHIVSKGIRDLSGADYSKLIPCT